MWSRLDDERWARVPIDADRPMRGTTLQADDTGDVVHQRWQHTDGRCALHVSDADPELLVYVPARGDDPAVIREYDIPGQRATPDEGDPLRDAVFTRAAVADGDDPWDLLRGWS